MPEAMYDEEEQQLIKMDEAIRENLQKANQLTSDLAKTDSEITAVEKSESDLRIKIAARQAEIEKLMKISEELELENQAKSSKLQVRNSTKSKFLYFLGLELKNRGRPAPHQVHQRNL